MRQLRGMACGMVVARRWGVAFAVAAALLAPARAARPRPSLDGTWTGTFDVMPSRAHGTASGSLAASGRVVQGTLALDAAGVAGTFAIRGTVRGPRAAVNGAFGAARLRWRARFSRRSGGWRGPLVVRGAAGKVRGVLALAPDGGGDAPVCGGDFFASDVMPVVVDPICSQCHVPGGLAQAAAFKVTPGDPVATSKSAAREIDYADPLQSKLLLKPLARMPHGGGQRIAPGSAEEQALVHWIELVTAPGCASPGGGGGGGGTGAELYASNCASCHGPEARGLDGRPDIHCNRAIADAVKNGRVGPSGEMQPFTTLSDADIAKIQGFLLGLCPTTSVTGADLYASNCATCHGADATGAPGKPSVRCATRVADAVRVGRGAAMPAFPGLSDAEVGLVGDFLAGLCDASGRGGADLYAGNCATCHGAAATGGQNALGVAGPEIRCNRNVAAPVTAGETPDMPAFPGLSPSDVSALQTYLTTALCPVGSVSGADLFTSNCATCHGPGGTGTASAPNVRCATRVADAMQLGRGARMPAFAGVVASEVSMLQAYLTGVCDQLGRPGLDLYAGNCSSCHGATARGGQNGLGVHGPDIRCTEVGDYQEKVASGDEGMPAFPALGSPDVMAIVGWVHATFCGGG